MEAEIEIDAKIKELEASGRNNGLKCGVDQNSCSLHRKINRHHLVPSIFNPNSVLESTIFYKDDFYDEWQAQIIRKMWQFPSFPFYASAIRRQGAPLCWSSLARKALLVALSSSSQRRVRFALTLLECSIDVATLCSCCVSWNLNSKAGVLPRIALAFNPRDFRHLKGFGWKYRVSVNNKCD